MHANEDFLLPGHIIISPSLRSAMQARLLPEQLTSWSRNGQCLALSVRRMRLLDIQYTEPISAVLSIEISFPLSQVATFGLPSAPPFKG